MSSILRCAAIVTCCALALCSARADAESLSNGSFEVGPTISATGQLSMNIGTTSITGWTTTRGKTTYLNDTYWVANTGTHSVALHENQAGGIQQTFASQPGAVYRLSFVMSGEPFVAPTVRRLRATAAGQVQDFSADVSQAWHWDMGWVARTWDFTANAASTTLELYSLETGMFGPAIDDVSVQFVSSGVGGASGALAFAPPSPSPARSSTQLSFVLPRTQSVRLTVHDVSGREVARLIDATLPGGSHARTWDVSALAAGVYLVRLEADGVRLSRRVAVIR